MNAARIFVCRFIVFRDNHFVYDQEFHSGINIIRGENSTGKSTVMDLLYYALGGELTKWTKEQELCTHVHLEVSINSRPMCLRRDIRETGKAPMFFYDGNSDAALNDATNWFQYPNARSDDKHSYSQQLFELLGLPQHKTDDSKNLTMHQILRLIYVDQLTETTSLLKSDDKWDNPVIRKAIGEFMLGVDDLEAHNLRQQLITANKVFESINGELLAIQRVLRSEDQVFKKEILINEIKNSEKTIQELEQKKTEIRSNRLQNLNEEIRERTIQIDEQLKELVRKRDKAVEEKGVANAELIDTQQFLVSVKERLHALENSSLTSSELGEVSFQYCPSCLSPIKDHQSDTSCGLCKTEYSTEQKHYAYLQLVNELNFQVKESEELIEEFQKVVDDANIHLPKLDQQIVLLKNEYHALTENIDAVDASLCEAAADIGFYKSQIVNLNEKLEFVEKIEDLRDRKEQANANVTKLKGQLKEIESQNEERRLKIFGNIEDTAKSILQDDGGYEEAFKTPEEVSFDFGKDRMFVNGRAKFSASSMVVMKNAIRSAIFLEAVKDASLRFPRLYLNDNIEDKGMTPERSHSFQLNLVELCEALESKYQVIFTTSMIHPDLNVDEYVVGPFYPKGSHTLAIG